MSDEKRVVFRGVPPQEAVEAAEKQLNEAIFRRAFFAEVAAYSTGTTLGAVQRLFKDSKYRFTLSGSAFRVSEESDFENPVMFGPLLTSSQVAEPHALVSPGTTIVWHRNNLPPVIEAAVRVGVPDFFMDPDRALRAFGDYIFGVVNFSGPLLPYVRQDSPGFRYIKSMTIGPIVYNLYVESLAKFPL